ncbi:hypothetical protein ACEQPO_04585 [Bacillus sp. SL00103]
MLAVKINSISKNGQVCSAQMKRFLEKAGHPDPLDIQDNKMVDEGAMTLSITMKRDVWKTV